MNAGPTGMMRNFKAGGPPGLTGTVASSITRLEPNEEERMAAYGLVHGGALAMSQISPWGIHTLHDHGMLALAEQRGVGIDIGAVRLLHDENPTRYSQMVQVGRGLGAEAVHMTTPFEVPVSNHPVLTRPLELDAAQISQLTVDELRYRISLRTGDMHGLHLPKAMLVKMLIAVERTRNNMQNAIRASDPNMPLRLP